MRRFNDERDDVVRDGERVRVPMAFMDATQAALTSGTRVHDGTGQRFGLHRPGYRFVGDGSNDPRVKAFDQNATRSRNAWKNPGRTDADNEEGEEPEQRSNDVEAARAASAERSRNAWRQPSDVETWQRAMEQLARNPRPAGA